MSNTFTPPSIAEVPPIGVEGENPQGVSLMRFFQSRQRGVAVFKMSDGTYRAARSVTGLTQGSGGTVPVLEPYPAIPEIASNGQGGVGVVNDALAWSWVFETGTQYPLTQPTVSIVYNGGHSYTVSSAEAAALTAAGFGAYLS